jgi:radical SAM enzyme (TIGR01210 family)
MLIDKNPYLGAVMRAVRAGRPMLAEDQSFYTRVEKVPAGNYVEIWFRTGGCTWDHAGGCTMCNYGVGAPVTATGVRDAVAAALNELEEPANELMISPSGGMWDPGEVPTEALAPIYALAAAARPRRFFVETRAETVSVERIAQMRAALPGVELAVEVGLESAFDPVLAYCVNKGSNANAFIQAVDIVRSQGAAMYANVSLGTAFLDRPTAVHDAVNTVCWALDHGADNAVLFPLHIKPFTLLEFLSTRGRYQQVTLWDLVETLDTLGPDRARRVEIAWYKSYYDTAKKVTTSPSGCARCHERLMTDLDRYRATLDFAIIADLQGSRCVCAAASAVEGEPIAGAQIAANVVDQYAWLSEALGLQSMWQRWRPRLEPAIQRAFADYAPESSRTHVV